MKNFFSILLMFTIVSQVFAETNQQTKNNELPCENCNINTQEQWLAFTPILFFALIIIIIFWKLNKEGYKIGDALKENITIEVSEDNPAIAEKPKAASTGVQDATVVPQETTEQKAPFVPRTIQPKSTSRLIAFISGMVSIGIASSLCSFWMYNYFNGCKTIDLSHLSNVLLALGLGVIPYAVNKVSTAK